MTKRSVGLLAGAAGICLAACGSEGAPGEVDGPSVSGLTVEAEPPGFEFRGAAMVTLTPSRPARVYYTLDGTDPTPSSPTYDQPIVLTESTLLSFIAIDESAVWSKPGAELYSLAEKEHSIDVLPRSLRTDTDALFFAVPAGDTSTQIKTVRLTSFGREPVFIRRITLVANPDSVGFYQAGIFEILTPFTAARLPTGESITLDIAYAPTTTLKSAAILIESDDPRNDGRHVIELWGRIFDW